MGQYQNLSVYPSTKSGQLQLFTVDLQRSWVLPTKRIIFSADLVDVAQREDSYVAVFKIPSYQAPSEAVYFILKVSPQDLDNLLAGRGARSLSFLDDHAVVATISGVIRHTTDLATRVEENGDLVDIIPETMDYFLASGFLVAHEFVPFEGFGPPQDQEP